MADYAVRQNYKSFDRLTELTDYLRGFAEVHDEDDIEDVVIEKDMDEWDLTIYYRK